MASITGRMIALEVDGTDHSDEVGTASINSAESESDWLSFAMARGAGGRDYVLALKIKQDDATGTLWSEIWENVGDTVPFVLAPHGNATPSVSQPHYEGNAVISEPDGVLIGGEANRSTTSVQVVEVEWKMTARPTRVTA